MEPKEKIAFFTEELEKAEKEQARQERIKLMSEAARTTREFLDEMEKAGISEDRAWKMWLTILKNQ